MRLPFQPYRRNTAGSVTVETSLVLMFMIALTGGAIEGGYAFWQWNGAQEAARVGARLAAVSPPVARDLETMTGLSNSTDPGDPMPDYSRTCSGANTSCNSGGYNSAVMNGIVFGPDNDGICGETTRERRGMCDVFTDIELKNVIVEYKNSGLGTAGNPASPAPLITVTVRDFKFNFVFLNIFIPEGLSTMTDVSVTVMSEDMRAGA